MKRPHSSFLSSPALVGLLVALFAAITPSQGQAQFVLESGGVEFTAPSMIEMRTVDGDIIDVQEITGRATATARGYGRNRSASATVSTESTVHVCETPCRFQLQRPMEVRVDVHAVRLRPDGSHQRYLIDRQNRAGRALGVLAVSLGLSGVVSGAILIGIDAIPASEFDSGYGDDGVDMGRVGVISLVSGGALLLVGIIAMVASKGRIERVDGFDF